MRNKAYLTIALLTMLQASIKAQVNVRDSATQGMIFGIGAGYYVPGGQMAERFGNNGDVSFDVWYKTKNNYLFGIGGSFLFGNDVKVENSMFRPLEGQRGLMFDLNGNFGEYKVLQRGFIATAGVGKIFNQLGHNRNSGLVLFLNGGYVQHRIRIENNGQNMPQINEPYYKGYDQLSGGLALRQFIGYLHSGNRRTINFLIGFDFLQGFTEDFRGYNYVTGSSPSDIQNDFINGVRFIWFLPVYDKNNQQYYYR